MPQIHSEAIFAAILEKINVVEKSHDETVRTVFAEKSHEYYQ
jgi:hypothetical protein